MWILQRFCEVEILRPILLVGKKEEWSLMSCLMTWLVNQGERYLGSGVLTPGFSVYIASLFCPETTHWVIPAFYLCYSMNWDPFTKADLYYQCPRRPTNRLSSLIIIFGFCCIEGLIFGNHRLQKTINLSPKKPFVLWIINLKQWFWSTGMIYCALGRTAALHFEFFIYRTSQINNSKMLFQAK